MSRFIHRRLAVASLLLWSFGVLAEHYTVPLLVPAPTTGAPQGVVRILNGTDESGTVEIYAINDAGTRSGPAAFTLNASAAVQFTATDLASGNATLGLTGGIGTDVGDARLQIETDLAIVPLAFVRAADGTLSAMHDTVRGASVGGSDGYTYEVPIFNPASDVTQASRLRLINPGDAAAAVTIGGRDDSGAVATGGDVTLMLAAGGGQTLTAQQLEAGDTAITGRLGAGTGKWRLTVSSDQPLQVVNIVAATAGYWNNLSTTAAPGAAPADLESLNERFVGNAVVYVTGSNRFTLNAQTGERFTETAEIDGVSTTYMGSYGYAAIGPDAGRMTLSYDDGDVCAANLYFSTHTAGWFASRCTGTDYPADGTWLGGSWSVEEDEGDGGEVTGTTYGVDDTLPGVPTSGLFIPSVTSGGSVTASGAGTTIALNSGGYFELSDGTRYTCTSADGCAVANGTVTRGTVARRAAGDGEVDQFPTFRTAVSPGDRTYTVGTAIDALTLPEASSGNAPLSYSLTPSVPGLTFDATARQLTGTPSTAGTYAMTYTVTDEDGDTDTLSFTITVNAGTTETGSLGECYVSLSVSIGQSCTYPGTTDAFSVNDRGRGSFLTFLAGIRIRITNQTINGRVYDIEASHQGDGVWRIDRIAGSTEVPTGGGMVDTGEGDDDNDGVSNSNDAFPQDPDESTDTDGDGIGNNADTDDDNDGISDIDDPCRLDRDNACSVGVTIPDANLRAAIEDALGKASGATITVAELETLTLFNSDRADIRELTGLDSAINLRILSLPRNNISDLSALAGLTNLEKLSLPGNTITDISPLANLTNLKTLHLGGVKVTDISALAGLTNLESLSLQVNTITDISPLANLTNLQFLNLSVNTITDLSALASLAELTGLYLGENNISDISPLANLTNLRELNLSENAITDISALASLTELTGLFLSDNKISDLAPLVENTGLGSGTLLIVTENPLNAASKSTHVPALLARGARVSFDDTEFIVFTEPQIYNDNVFVLPVSENLAAGNLPLQDYAARFYEYFSDSFDFLMFFPHVYREQLDPEAFRGAHYSGVKNDVRGIGKSIFFGDGWGSAGRLQGAIYFSEAFYGTGSLYSRLITGPSLHELMHRWANYVLPTSSYAHWGFSGVNGALGGFIPDSLVDLGGGRYRAAHFSYGGYSTNNVFYKPIELYLAGFIPSEEVPDIWVAEDGQPVLNENGEWDERTFVASRVKTYTIEDIIAEHGPRVPDHSRAQKDFRAAAILLISEDYPVTRGKLEFLSADASWFSYAGEAESVYSNFYEATGGRATISMDGLSQFQSRASPKRLVPRSFGTPPPPVVDHWERSREFGQDVPTHSAGRAATVMDSVMLGAGTSRRFIGD